MEGGEKMKIETLKVTSKKEVRNMIKKYLIVSITLLTFLFNVFPAQAYVELKTPVAISATGTLSGTTIAFTVGVVTQATGSALTEVNFTSPSGLTDSGAALKIKGGTNEVNSRVIIYTDNDNNTGGSNKVTTVDPSTGVDGGGLVGQTDPGYSVALYWGCDTSVNNSPNNNVNYVFGDPKTPVEGGAGNCVYIVDKRHTHSFTTKNSTLDNTPLYDAAGAPVTNIAGDELYPQGWDYDLYNSATERNDETRVSPALYKSIATVAFGIATGADTDEGYYIANVGKLQTLATDDTITARLSKTDATAGGEMYIAVGGDFRGMPAQTYSTGKLYVAIVQN